MKTFSLEILCCLSLGILGLHAATAFLAPPVIPKGSPIPGGPYSIPATSPTIFDGTDGYYVIVMNSKGVSVDHFILASDAGAIPHVYDKLVELENTTQAKALKYVKNRLQ